MSVANRTDSCIVWNIEHLGWSSHDRLSSIQRRSWLWLSIEKSRPLRLPSKLRYAQLTLEHRKHVLQTMRPCLKKSILVGLTAWREAHFTPSISEQFFGGTPKSAGVDMRLIRDGLFCDHKLSWSLNKHISGSTTGPIILYTSNL